jgi:uncharacterized protein YecE (DUF72 family)
VRVPPAARGEHLTVLIGTSGWQYDSWRGAFYPRELPKSRWLEHYSARFQSVEVNNTFYRLPTASVFAAWAERTPDDFVVTVKASRYLTHVRRLRQPEEPVRRLLDAVGGLGSKLGVVLVQLPPDMPARLGELDETLGSFPAGIRVGVEARHESWFTDEFRTLLERHDAALCLADRRSRPVTPLWRTASWGYVRLHEGRGTLAPCYGRTALASWARRLAGLFDPGDDVYVYFNNDPRGCAVRDARRFAKALTAVGLVPSRTG